MNISCSRISRFVLAGSAIFICLALVGCAGGGGSGTGSPVAPTPEDAVRGIVAGWQASGGPAFGVSSATGKPFATFGSVASGSGHINFYDLSGASWTFNIDETQRPTAWLANVVCSYIYRNLSQGIAKIVITFHMEFETSDQRWYLAEITVYQLPVAVVIRNEIRGFVFDEVTNLPVSGAKVDLYSQVGSAWLASTSTASDGFYRFTDVPAGSYHLVIARTGYQDKTVPITVSY